MTPNLTLFRYRLLCLCLFFEVLAFGSLRPSRAQAQCEERENEAGESADTERYCSPESGFLDDAESERMEAAREAEVVSDEHTRVEEEFTNTQRRWTGWLSVGPTAGTLIRPGRNDFGFVVGGELSLVWASGDPSSSKPEERRGFGLGLVLDAAWVSDPSHFRGAVGAEVLAFYRTLGTAGLEVAATFHNEGKPLGYRVRGFMHLLGFMAYVGIDFHERQSLELGVQVKIPVQLL